MNLKFSLAAFLAAVPATLAAPQTSWTSELTECLTIWPPNCQFDWEIWYEATGNAFCVCKDNPYNEPSLAEFFTGTDYTDVEYQSSGQYGVCYDLPQFLDQKSNSMISGTTDKGDPLVCCIYTGQGCDTDKYAWTSVPANVSEFKGFYENGVRSFQCSPWLNDWSQCWDKASPPSYPASQDPPAGQSPPGY